MFLGQPSLSTILATQLIPVISVLEGQGSDTILASMLLPLRNESVLKMQEDSTFSITKHYTIEIYFPVLPSYQSNTENQLFQY